MRRAWRNLAGRVDAASLRERAIGFALVLGVLVAAWDRAALAPLERTRAGLEGQVATLHRDLQALNAQASALLEARRVDPDATRRRERRVLLARVERLDDGLARLTDRLVPPREMARVLEAMLAREEGLSLVRLEGLGAEPLLAPREAPPAADPRPAGGAASPAGRGLYRHGLRIVLEGGYLDALRYLRALEGMAWRFIWDGVVIEVTEHPRARVSVTVHSLSLDDGWIGV